MAWGLGASKGQGPGLLGTFSGPVLGLAMVLGSLGLAQTATIVAYQGTLQGELTGSCPALPSPLRVWLLMRGDQGYLLGQELPASSLKGQGRELEVLAADPAIAPPAHLSLQGDLGQAVLEASLAEQTPTPGNTNCRFMTARLSLQLAQAGAPEWWTLAESEFQVLPLIGRSDWAKAVPALQKLVPLSQELRGEQDGLAWAEQAYLGLSLGGLGRWQEALLAYERAYSRLKLIRGERDGLTLFAQQGLVTSLSALGYFRESLPLLDSLIANSRAAYGEGNPTQIASLSNKASNLNQLGQRQEALEVYRETLALARKYQGGASVLTLSAWRQYANQLLLLGRSEEALTELQTLLQLSQKQLGENDYQTARTREAIGTTLLNLGRYSQALAYLEPTLADWQQRFGPDDPNTVSIKSGVALARHGLGQAKEASAVFAEVIAQVEKLRRQLPSASQRRELFGNWLSFYEIYMLDLIEQDNFQEAFKLAELRKGRTLLDQLVEQRAAQLSNLPQEALDRLALFERTAAQVDALVQQASSANLPGLLAQRSQLYQDYADYRRELQARYPRYAALSQGRTLDVAEGLKALDADTAFISYAVLGEESLVAFILNQKQGGFVYISIPPGFAQSLEAYRRMLESPFGAIGLERQGVRVYRLGEASFRLVPTHQAPPEGARRVTDWRQMSQELGKLLLGRVYPIVKNYKTLLISPDGPLHFLPFETLSIEGKLLIEQHTVHSTQSLSVYALLKNRSLQYKSLRRDRSLLALGNPDYQSAGVSSPVVESLRQRGFPLVPLPGAELEAREAAGLFAPQADLWIGSEASEARLRQMDAQKGLERYRYLLLAAHGYIDPENPQQVALLLSQSGGSDGVLGIEDLLQLSLRSDLVLLSACNTGLGQQVSGEGVVGLAYALYIAGNTRTLMTLWSINDAKSAAFTPKLLARLKAGKPPEVALSETKREFLNTPGLEHPAYWAGFVLY